MGVGLARKPEFATLGVLSPAGGLWECAEAHDGSKAPARFRSPPISHCLVSAGRGQVGGMRSQGERFSGRWRPVTGFHLRVFGCLLLAVLLVMRGFGAPGDLDPMFPNLANPNERIEAAVGPDGRLYLAISISTGGALPALGIARYSPEGRRDPTYLGGEGRLRSILHSQLAVGPEGEVYLYGTFLGPGPTNGVCRLREDGSWDAAFPPILSDSGEDQPDQLFATRKGRLLVSWGAREPEGFPLASWDRLGNPDPGFAIEPPPKRVLGMTERADGAWLVCGNFHSWGGLDRAGLAILGPQGESTLDTRGLRFGVFERTDPSTRISRRRQPISKATTCSPWWRFRMDPIC